ncbi:MAG: hypothetical protein U5K69_09225 [Balneolaceae bacterium]|nr:hypothetical protein [Balneolaceae bacterium]
MLRQPDVSETHIVFAYADDIWIVSREGGTGQPLDGSPAVQESFPRFSPDGSMVAYQCQLRRQHRYLRDACAQAAFLQRITHHPMTERDARMDARRGAYLCSHPAWKAVRQRYSQFYTVFSRGRSGRKTAGTLWRVRVPFRRMEPTIAYTPKTTRVSYLETIPRRLGS